MTVQLEYIICLLQFIYAGIMLKTYYAQNYAGIISWSLHSCIHNVEMFSLQLLHTILLGTSLEKNTPHHNSWGVTVITNSN